MKKFNIVLVSIFTIILGTVLSSCGFKQPSVNFTEDEILISVGQGIELKDYLSVSEVDTDDVQFAFSNSSFFTMDNSYLTPNAYGQTNVYALVDGNTLDSMHIVVKKEFEKVENVTMDDNGLVTWNQVVDKFDETQNFVSPTSYQVNVTYQNPNTNESNTYSEIVNSNSYQLTDEGRYTLNIVSVGKGYFDNSEATETILYFGYMPKLLAEDFSFDVKTNTLSWANVSSANFTITFNNAIVVENLSENSFNLGTVLSSLDAGSYSLIVTTNDVNGEKISVDSEEITINKVDNSSAEFLYDEENGGRYNFELPENAESVVVTLGEQNYTFSETTETIFPDLAQGTYEIFVQAVAEDSLENGIFYASSSVESVGYIYKLGKVTISGTGNNEENDTTFNFDVTRTDSGIETNLAISLNENTVNEAGFTSQDSVVNKEVTNLTAGSHALTISQITGQENVQIEDVAYSVINSDESDSYSFTKLSSFSEINLGETISHSYVEENSVLEFNLVNNAEEYALYVQGAEDFTLVDSSNYSLEDGVITFNGKLENLFVDNFQENVLTFKLVALGNEENVISSSTIKTLTRLDTPTSSAGNEESGIYSWNEVLDAGRYNVRYAVISKEQYDAGIDELELEGLSFTTEEITETQIELDAGNYYYIEIFALPENESVNLTSQVFKTIFYLSEKLITPNVDFMYGILGEEDTASYYIRVENVENMASLTVQLDNEDLSTYNLGQESEYTIYRLTEDFSTAYNGMVVSVVAHSVDETIYLDSETYNLTIRRLRAIQYSDLQFDELTKTVTIAGGREGVTSIVLSDGETDVEENNVDTTLPIYDIENGNITVLLKGSENVEGVYQKSNNTVYLDSSLATFNIMRVDRPTNFTYNNGNLTFTATHSQANDFVLDVYLTDANDNQTLFKISNLNLNNDALTQNYPTLSVYGVNGEDLTEILDNLTIENILLSSVTTNNYSIDLNTIMSFITSNDTLNSYYSQAVKVEFGIYCYKITLNNSIYLNSYYGTLLSDTSKTLLEVQKMASPTISYDKTTNTLSWASVGDGLETTYVVYQEGRGVLSRSTANSYQINLSSLTLSQDYTFYVTATNPYYLESAQSNEILIHRLNSVNQVTLSNNNLQFTPNSYDNTYINSATVQIDENTAETIYKDTNFSHLISANGVYTLKYLGITDYESEGRFYLDSQGTTFTIADITTLAPSNNNVTFESNVVSFNAFGENANLQSVTYYIVFTDESGNYATKRTKENSLTISLDDADLVNLNSETITINVYATLETYSVSAGGTVYYSGQTSITPTTSLYNVYKYTSEETITKLATPEITNIEFISRESQTYDSMPTMRINIAGNYSLNETFLVFFGDNDEIIKEVNCIDASSDGQYYIDLTFDEYSNYFVVGQSTEISVIVRSSVNLPSTEAVASVYRNDTLKSISHNSERIEIGDVSLSSYNSTITLTFKDAELLSYASGGIALKITYTPNDGKEQVADVLIPSSSYEVGSDSVTYTLPETIRNTLENGGVISYSAFINSYSDNQPQNKTYYLPSQSIQSDVEYYEILATPSLYTRTNGGIQIVEETPSINTVNTKYLVSYHNGTEVVNEIIGQEEGFYFEFPSEWANNTEYTIVVTAYENNKIISSPTEISVSLSRLERVSNITLNRNAEQVVYLEWNDVPNATSYIVRAYIGQEMLEIEVDSTSFTLYDIFGDNYNENVLSGYLTSGTAIRFDIIACNHTDATYTDSPIQSVNATLIGSGSNLTSYNIDMGEDGLLYFQGVAGETYLYRLVAQSASSETFDWKEITLQENGAVLIDLTQFENLNETTNFNVEVKKKGDVDGTVYNTDSTNLQLDSVIISSSNVFQLSDTVKNVAFDSVNVEKITISLNNQDSRVFASLEDKFNVENATELSIVDTEVLDENFNYIYNINYTEILDELDLQPGQNTIYFYTLQGNSLGTYVNVISFNYEFTFTVDTGEILAVEKVPDTVQDDTVEGVELDLSKTQMVFSYDANIVGFYFRVDYTSPLQETSVSKFTYSLEDCSVDVDNGQIILDLSLLFSSDEVDNGVGVYKLSVSILKSSNGLITFSDYITQFNDAELEFTKLPDLASVNLNSGNLVWSIDRIYEIYASLADKYYIYFVSVENPNEASRYETSDNLTTSYNGDLFSAAYNEYNVYVIAVAENPFVIASNPRYILDDENQIKNVAKNRFNSELTLSGSGTLSINWNANGTDGGTYDEHDIYSLLSQENITVEYASDFVNNIFFYPFTFTLQDLVNGNVQVRLKFTSYDENTDAILSTQTITIDAMYLLAELDIPNLSEKLTSISNALTSASDRNLVTNFQNRINNQVCGGIGNYINLFDSFFERIQPGKYRIEYCLLGNASTFTSTWYTLKRDVEEENNDVFYVNSMPRVTAQYEDIDAGESIARTFSLRISQSDVYGANGSLSRATTYFLQLKSNTNKYGFEISNISGTWTCKQYGDEGETFNVYTDGNDLILYLNLNGENSLKSKYNDIVNSGSFSFEIFAQGNEYSISSKSQYYTLAFNGACHNFKVENGTFTWQSHEYYPTRVVYKLSTSTGEAPPIDLESETTANLSLTLEQDGLYDYIKFITLGDITGNNIRVDSETFMIEDVYKLSRPTLQTDFNMLRITENENNLSQYAGAYTSDAFKKYEIYNDVSTASSSFRFTDTNLANRVSYYETGTTYYDTTSQDYTYKNTEAQASTFYVSTLGSTSDFNSEQYMSSGSPVADVYSFVLSEEGASGNILLRSTTNSVTAKMLNPISSRSLGINNGVVSWNEDGILGDYTLEGGASLVYKVTLSFYSTSTTESGENSQDFLSSDNNIVRYTANTSFDIAQVASEFPTSGSFEFIKITIQAMALNIINEEEYAPSDRYYAELVEGGFVSGVDITMTSQTEGSYRVLMSNGVSLEGIILSTPVENVQLDENGHLTWTYHTNENVVFIVEDENGNVISGTDTNVQNGESYTYTFVEAEGALSGGEHTLTVYAVQTSLQGQNIIKSTGVSLSGVIKIGRMTTNDYTISATTLYENNVPVNVDFIDFSNYFDNNNYNDIESGTTVDLTINISYDSNRNITISSSADANKKRIIVFSSEEDATILGSERLNEYAGYIVVSDALSLNIQITGQITGSSSLSIMSSDNYTLELRRPTNDISISYDETSQVFNWTEPTLDVAGSEVVYVVSITYNNDINRIYQITETTFMPTIIGEITEFRVAIKYGENALQSTFVIFDADSEASGTQTVNFDLFVSGEGTSTSPYIINSAETFKNIAQRMEKPTYLLNYTQNGVEESEVSANRYFYFEINLGSETGEIQLEEFDGILFKGTFNGVIRGGGNTISYTSNYSSVASRLSSTVTVSVGRITGLNTGENAVYNYGLSLFETLGNNAEITNLSITPNFTSAGNIGNNIIVAGLAIANFGDVTTVNVNGLTSNLVVYSASQGRIGAYAGLVGINNGLISSCVLEEDITLSDTQNGITYNQYFFIGGLVYTNYSEIYSSEINANITLNITNQGNTSSTRHQIAGIAVTSTSSSTLVNNRIGVNSATSETYRISFNAGSSNYDQVYIAGISVLSQTSNYTSNTANTGCTFASQTSGTVYIADEINPTTPRA